MARSHFRSQAAECPSCIDSSKRSCRPVMIRRAPRAILAYPFGGALRKRGGDNHGPADVAPATATRRIVCLPPPPPRDHVGAKERVLAGRGSQYLRGRGRLSRPPSSWKNLPPPGLHLASQ